jgi:UDP-GlcNAc:undecaprenyl-phosphate GlcNAc-1-phosphate transferase
MNDILQLIFTSITSFTICFFAIPSIIKVANLKHLYDEPCERKKHKSNVPTLGGIAIFAGFIFSTTFWANQNDIVELQFIIASLIILFFMGIKDDIVNLVAHKKLLGQIMAAVIIVYFADIRLTSLYGIFDIYDIPYWASLSFSLFTVIAITNAFNLIDGIDTLAASVGTLSVSVFGAWFYLVGHTQYAILSAAMVGSLIAFLHYNKTPARIFMGDTGSLVLGLVNSVLAIKFIEFNKVYKGPDEYEVFSVPAVAIGVLIIPIFDTARVFILRILEGRSPLSSDRNHIHHILIDLGYSHIKATLILISVNSVIIFNSFYNQKITGELLLFINLVIIATFSLYNTRRRRILRKKSKNKKEKLTAENSNLFKFRAK